jgi:mannose-6-phosphate isomerase-like protein (cupin superfamily)
VVGRTIVNGKLDRPGEIRGVAITGGTSYVVKTGDTLYVPKNVARQFQVEAGRYLVCTVVKMTPAE